MIAFMKVGFQEERHAFWLSLLMVLTALAVPMSSSAKSIMIPIVIAFIILTPRYRQDLLDVFSINWCRSLLPILFMALFACLWSPATYQEQVLVLDKYIKLLALPILAIGFQEARVRMLSIHVFLLAMLITCIISILKALGLSTYHDPQFVGAVFHNHIITSYMMTFAAYVCAWRLIGAFKQNHAFPVCMTYAILFTLFSYQVLFINSARTGYVLYSMLIIILITSQLSWRRMVAGMMGLVVLFATSYMMSVTMQENVYKTITEIKMYSKNNKNTSIGFRFQFHDYAEKLFKNNPLIGNGTAAFMHLYAKNNPVPARIERVLEPHSQYWLMASEWGLAGLIAFAGLIASLLHASWQLTTMRPLAFGLLLPFIVGNISDSVLYYSGSGYFFVVFMALCLGEGLPSNTSNHRNSSC